MSEALDGGRGLEALLKDGSSDGLNHHVLVGCAVQIGVDAEDVIGVDLMSCYGIQVRFHGVFALPDAKDVRRRRNTCCTVEDEIGKLGEGEHLFLSSASGHPVENLEVCVSGGTGHDDGFAVWLDSPDCGVRAKGPKEALRAIGGQLGDPASLSIFVENLCLQTEGDSTLQSVRDILELVKHFG